MKHIKKHRLNIMENGGTFRFYPSHLLTIMKTKLIYFIIGAVVVLPIFIFLIRDYQRRMVTYNSYMCETTYGLDKNCK